MAGSPSSSTRSTRILPQFVFGGGWSSSRYFTNTGATPASFPFNFVSDDGTPLSVPGAGGSSTTVSLAAHGTAMIEAPNNGPNLEGYVSMSLPQGVQSYGIFRSSAPGYADQEAVVPVSSAFSTASTLIWDETSRRRLPSSTRVH